MKLLWLCNMAPSVVQEKISGKKTGGLWVDHVLAGLRQQGVPVRILCPGDGGGGTVDENCSYGTFPTGLPYEYKPEVENRFAAELGAFSPDVIHIWGTEYAHTLAMVNAAEKTGLLNRVVIHIQGLCSIYAGHYAEGVPYEIQRKATFRDRVRQDNILQQQKKFALRGELEVQALRKVRHVIGRTHWDEACAKRINPSVIYHFCNETLREPFYTDSWNYESCAKHRIFASSCVYPIKGFHYLLEAFGELAQDYPDAILAVPGQSFLQSENWKQRLRRNSYQNYLAEIARRYRLENRIEFLGSLSAEQMKREYRKANVFVLPSTIENSPNSLGEAMLLGVPCIAGDVGGVTTMLEHKKEGYVYQSTAPYVLTHFLRSVFEQKERAAVMGTAAKAHAAVTHDPEKNLRDLMEIYRELVK